MSVTNESPNADHLLTRFGYKSQYKREIKRFASFAIGFSFISITTGIFTTYGSVLGWGGPLGIWTWPFVALGQLLVALVFAALASRIPLAGYSYQWASRLTNPKLGWLIGWVSFMFLIVVTVSVDYSIAFTVLPALFNYGETPLNAWAVTACIILIQMMLIIYSTVWSTRINNAAVGTEVVGIVGLTLLLIIVGAVRGILHPDHLFSMGAVPAQGYFNLGTLTKTGPFMLSFLLGSYTIVGFEAAANLSEETQDAHKVVPFAMWSAVVLSGVVGFLFLIALNLASGDLTKLASSATPVADIVTGTLGSVIGSIFLVLVTFSIFACGLVIFITATRLTWAMSRDRRFPAHAVFSRVNERTGTPVTATILLGILIEAVLAAFATQTNTLASLFSASSLLPTIIYLATVILYATTRNKLPSTNAFKLGMFEWPVVVLSLIWLLFELAIFRDVQFATPWLYCAIMFAIGIAYFVWMLVSPAKVLETLPESKTPELDVVS